MKAEQKRVMVRKKAQVCPICKKPAATLLEWPQRNWWPAILCWPCVQEHIEKDHEQLEAAQDAALDLTNRLFEEGKKLEAARKEIIAGDALANVQHEGDLEEYKQLALQLEAAQADYAEADKDNYRLRQLLEAAEQERDAWRRVFGGWTPAMAKVEAPKILRRAEEAERAFGALSSLAAGETEALGAVERRLGEALAALEEVTTIELYTPTWNMQWMKARDKARAVLASQTEKK